MDPIINLFKADSFSSASLAAAIENRAPVYADLRVKEIFEAVPVATTSIQIDQEDTQINLVPQGVRGGGKAVKNKRPSRKALVIDTPMRRLIDTITAKDIQDKRQTGSVDLETVENVVAKALSKSAIALDQTQLYMQLQALQGKLVDPDGTTLYDLFSELGISRTTLDFALATGTTEVTDKIIQLQDSVVEGLKGSAFSGIRVYADTGWFRKFVTHPTVKEVYKGYEAARQMLGGNASAPFIHNDVEFVKVSNKFSVVDAYGNVTVKTAIPANEAFAVPLGTDLAEEYLSPADHLQFVKSARF